MAHTANQKKLLKLLNEIFQLDRSDLDFGIYRIMNTKSKEINNFLDKELLSSVVSAFNSNDNHSTEKELEDKIKSFREDGFTEEQIDKNKKIIALSLHAKLAEMNVQKKRLQGVEEHAEEIMEKAIEKIKTDLIANTPVADEGRKNELSNALSMDLRKLANRIDRGFNIEVRVEPIEIDEESEEEESEDVKRVQAIEGAMKEMKFMNIDGKPILHLSESKDED